MEISKISVNGTSYDVKDSTARESCNTNAQAILGKVDKIEGKGLSTNDFNNTYKQALDNLDNTYAKKTDISDVYHFKGTVASYSALPNNPSAGDVYNITNADAEHNINAGDNVAWVAADGSVEGHWDNLAGIVNLPTMAVEGNTLVITT